MKLKWPPEFLRKELVIKRLRHYTLPQLFYSFLIMVSAYPFYKYVGMPAANWAHEQTEYRWVYFILLFLVIPILFFTTFYFTLGKRSTWIFSFDDAKPGARFSTAIILVFFGIIAGGCMGYHFSEMKRQLIKIERITDLRDHKDSTDEFLIKKYTVAYGYYSYTYEVTRRDRGSKHNHHYVTQLTTHFICPLLYDDYAIFQEDSQKYWVGFKYEKDLPDGLEHNDPIVLAEVENHHNKLREEDSIRYFDETDDNIFAYLVGQRIHNNILRNQVVIVEAHLENHEPYNGYNGLLYAMYVWLGSNLFMFLVLLQYDLVFKERSSD